jgi:DNA primase
MTPKKRFDLDELKRRHPLADVVGRYAEVRRSGERLVGRCPFHDDRHPSFAVHLPTETWQCYAASCGLGGDVIDLIGYAEHGRGWNAREATMFKEVVHRLDAAELPVRRQSVPHDWQQPRAWRPVELSPRTQQLLHLTARLYHTALLALGRGPSSPYAYLRERGLSDAILRREGVGYAAGDLLEPALIVSGFNRDEAEAIHLLQGQREFMAGRVVFIEASKAGQVLHLIGRAFAAWLHPESPKYLSLKEMDKPLYGYARLDKRPSSKPVLLVESPPDRLTALQWGAEALANVGSMMKVEHAAQLARLERPLFIVPHQDGGPGLAAAQQWRERIGRDLPLLSLPEGVKDLNELALQPEGEAIFKAMMASQGAATNETNPHSDADGFSLRGPLYAP